MLARLLGFRSTCSRTQRNWSQWLLVVALLGVAPALRGESAAAQHIDWRDFDAAAFAAARAEGKLVLLNLEAVWCHWCHVMAERTYSRADVAALLDAHFVSIKVDHDARPDLATRYRDYGWPATVVLSADGVDLARRAGYIAAPEMQTWLREIVADPRPVQERAGGKDDPSSHVGNRDGQLSDALRTQLDARHLASFDRSRGGAKGVQKYLDRDAVEYALVRAAAGDRENAQLAALTLDASRALIDPVWGGVYQYSTRGGWSNPHFEKLARLQGAYVRTYALAYGLWRRREDLAALHAIVGYLDGFLAAPDGGYYASQDADLVPGQHAADYFALDDAGRRARGIPRVDPHRYARENGVLIEALGVAYEFTGDASLLARAVRAAEWARGARRIASGGYRHDERDSDAAYLADNLAMARGLLQLYRVTAERAYLAEARVVANYIGTHFRASTGGFVPTRVERALLAPVPDIDDNIAMARFANLLAHYSGAASERALAEHAMRWLAQPAVALRRRTEAGVLLANDELANPPLHLTIRGRKDAAAAQPLFETALRVPGYYKRIEWWDSQEGPLPNPDVTYPELARPAAFVCTDRLCSVPLFDAADMAGFVRRRLPVPAAAPDGAVAGAVQPSPPA